MRIQPPVSAIFLSCFLFLGAGPLWSGWAPTANAQEAPEAAGAPASGAKSAPKASGNQEYVISPEQEALLADMVGRGATLEGCTLGSGQVEHKVVNVLYTCPGGEVSVQLAHPSQAPNGATETDQFAISLRSGTPPEGLLPALATRIREKEAAFEWTLAGEMGGGEHAPVSVSWVRLGVVSLFGVGIVWWILRARSSRKRAGS